jgi:hypothetical protein
MEDKKEIIVKRYKRNCLEADLVQFCYLQKADAFIEVSEWRNGDGFDITINEKIISLTRGEVKAIRYLTKKIK